MRQVYAERLSVLIESARQNLTGLLEISGVEADLQTGLVERWDRSLGKVRFADDPAVTEPANPSSGLLITSNSSSRLRELSSGRTLARSDYLVNGIWACFEAQPTLGTEPQNIRVEGM
jgi:hypothetical protein